MEYLSFIELIGQKSLVVNLSHVSQHSEFLIQCLAFSKLIALFLVFSLDLNLTDDILYVLCLIYV